MRIMGKYEKKRKRCEQPLCWECKRILPVGRGSTGNGSGLVPVGNGNTGNGKLGKGKDGNGSGSPGIS